ncbi:MAG: ATPase [uncultured Sulfurovum sp.]|uniref:ATPase n=1 Tax=uncultured Sulfurovum sp. TaxID=269237 RepID=A0A6S6UIP1_9BACT|nr:MAG: ATPase [uncultured Sulfurovum sp.]
MSNQSSNYPSLLAQFRSFCYQNKATDFEKAIEYFSVFGGMGWDVDMSVPLEKHIEKKVLKNYRYIHGDLTKVTHSKPIYHAMLTAIATGDRREYSAFKKVNVGREEGEEVIDFLVKDGFLVFDKSVEKPVDEKDGISDKLLFITPFMRFWFAMISPTYKSIKEGDYVEFNKRWEGMKHEFSTLIYRQLVLELVRFSFEEEFEGDPIISIGAYYDKNVEIDILAKRNSGAMLAGTCKLSKQKAKKSELSKLKEMASKAELEVEQFVLFSKNKFSTELKNEKGKGLRLFSLRNLSKLMDNLSEDDLLEYTNKKY